MTEIISPITLEIEKDLWYKFKSITPRTKTLNQAIVDLIKKDNKIKIKKKKKNE